ncbi:mycofactocin-coupled SDR family oxidoreductase [Mycobacterium sp. 94-17]|uniref:mycofactocin-coupled SDR family oxidoreductase n=1 Tax=Mycobacterium sp. 94-17 TaxID=2986147 RepID=UPI002D1F1557|nr:mycofactocin-coupled SDR family oxidoreductase [Mycobacterium sp. 94-17]MEB4209555.1 mycofactocin-coupled SDR family oxidoreductase [Mycobacterium sp. 94-17]
MNRVNGKVALVTGAARGQGRSHAVHLADEGADIIALDICADIATNNYPLGTTADLNETVELVEKSGQRCLSGVIDVRDRVGLKEFVARSVSDLGRLDIVAANAGIAPLGADVPMEGFIDVFDVNFVGVVNTVHVAVPHLVDGGSVIITGSVAGLVPQNGLAMGGGLPGPGGAGYGLSKKMIREYTASLALALGPQRIRVNAIHPTNVDTDMLHNDAIYRTYRPDLPNPTRADAEEAFPFLQAIPTPYVHAADISHAVVYLASDESRFVTGQQLFVDGGAALKLGL